MIRIFVIVLLAYNIMFSQNTPPNFYPNKLYGNDLDVFYSQKKTELKSIMLNKKGEKLDKNVEFFKMEDFNIFDNNVCLIKSNVISEGYLCPMILIEHFNDSNVENENHYQTILDNIFFFQKSNEERIASCLKNLNQILGFECSLDSCSSEFDLKISTSVSQLYRQIKDKSLREDLYFNFYVFIGERIIKKTNGNWQIVLQADFKHNVLINTSVKTEDLYPFLKPIDSSNSAISVNAIVKYFTK